MVRIDARNPFKPGSNEHRFTNQLISTIRQQNIILEQLWRRTGGGEDLVADTATREAYGWDTLAHTESDTLQGPDISYNEENNTNISISHEESPAWDFVYTSVNYTATGFDFVSASSGCSITFPVYPDFDERIKVKNADGSVIRLNPGAKTINGETSGKIYKKNTCIEFVYNGSEWVAA